MRKQAKSHHLVSRFYLRYFADEAEQITTVMLPGDQVFLQSIKRATVQTKFYTAIDRDGQTTDVAEQAFGMIEAEAADVWRQVSDGAWPLSEEDRTRMAGWIALQLLRGGRTRASMNQLGTDLLQLQLMLGGRKGLRQARRQAGEPHDEDTVTREWISLFDNPYEAEVHANHHLHHIAQLLPRVTSSLLSRWWILTVFERKSLATSDHPVHVLPNPDQTALGRGTGIENAAAIHLPLTRRLSLSMHLRGTLPAEAAHVSKDIRQRGVAATALYSNSCTVNSARRTLFHHPEDLPLRGLDLPKPRTREIALSGKPWRFMMDEDRQVLLDAGIHPPDAAGGPDEAA
ncbi:hypothetical protein BAY59_10225 [Prauserella coralliicola]|nr:hypothetical protein BAY59_10225 [Prauserella coralliicola]